MTTTNNNNNNNKHNSSSDGIISTGGGDSTSTTTTTAQQQQEERRRIVLETIQQRRSIYPKQYIHFNNNNFASSAAAGVPREILEEMLEAARWAPTHRWTQPWYFIVFATLESRQRLGEFLAQQYQKECHNNNKKQFSQAKYDKKIRNCTSASFVIAVCMQRGSTNNKNPELEDICSVAMAVQNMHLVATTATVTQYDIDNNNDPQPPAVGAGVGAYWSTGGIYGNEEENEPPPTNRCVVVTNPPALVEFLQLDPTTTTCLGWFFVGSYDPASRLPRGRRDSMNAEKVRWM